MCLESKGIKFYVDNETGPLTNNSPTVHVHKSTGLKCDCVLANLTMIYLLTIIKSCYTHFF